MPDKKIDIISEERLKKYFDITEKALAEAKKHINKERQEEAKEILKMAEAYVSDAKYFKKEGNWVNAFAALNYAHGWLDSGARLGIFEVSDSSIFTIK
jgi:hypothetical protein